MSTPPHRNPPRSEDPNLRPQQKTTLFGSNKKTIHFSVAHSDRLIFIRTEVCHPILVPHDARTNNNKNTPTTYERRYHTDARRLTDDHRPTNAERHTDERRSHRHRDARRITDARQLDSFIFRSFPADIRTTPTPYGRPKNSKLDKNKGSLPLALGLNIETGVRPCCKA